MKRLAVFAIFYLAFLAMVWKVDFADYAATARIHALNFAGAHYHCSPLENAKPFDSLVFYFCPPDKYKYINAFFLTFLALAFISISKFVTGHKAAGIAAAFLFITSNHLVPYVVISAKVSYLVFMLWALALYSNGRWRGAAIMLFLAGLSRPDAWVLGAVFAFRHIRAYFKANRAGNGTQTMITAVIPLLAPILWLLFDFRDSGDILGGAHQIAAYAATFGNVPGGTPFWAAVYMAIFKNSYCLPLIPLGVLALFFIPRYYGRNKTLALVIPALIPVFFYIVLFALGRGSLIPRFFIFPIAICYFAACLLPGLLFRGAGVIHGLVLALVCVVCFNGAVSFKYSGIAAGARLRTKATAAVADYLKGAKLPGKIIVGRNEDMIALALGEKLSHRLVTNEEAFVNPEIMRESRYFVYTVGDDYDPRTVKGFKLSERLMGGLAGIYVKDGAN